MSREQVQAAHDFIHAHGGLIELRPTNEEGKRQSGIYSNYRQLVDDAADYAGKAIQWTFNQLEGIEATNAVAKAKEGGCAQSKHVTRICNILVDVDPERESGVSATDAEHEAARQVAQRVRQYLKVAGFPEPLQTDSGNGFQDFYGTDLAPTYKELVRAFLAHLHAKFSTPQAKVDDSVYKLPQLARVPGTWNRKGKATPERPHRKSKVLVVPNRELVTLDMLLKLVPLPVNEEPQPINYDATVKNEIEWLESRKEKYEIESHTEDGIEFRIIRLAECKQKQDGGKTPGRPWIRIHPTQGVSGGCWHSECHKAGLAGLRKSIGGYEQFAETAIGLRAKQDDPHRLAHEHIERTKVNGHPTILLIGEDLHVWRGLWSETSDRAIAPLVTDTIKQSFDSISKAKSEKGGRATPLPVKRAIVADTINAIRSVTRIEEQESPFWLTPHAWAAEDVLPFRNGLLHLPSFIAGKSGFIDPTPAYFATHRLDFDYSPNAKQPERWLRFLAELWEDPACHDLLHEWGGYCLTMDTSLQKMMMLLGETRAGKGTIMWLLGRMVGGNFAAPSFKSLLADHGLGPLVGKQLVLFPDTKMMSARILEEVCAILKGVSGEDPITANLKYGKQVTTQLKGRMMIPSNDLLAIQDSSGALQARQLFLLFTKSFKGGKEDTRLKAALLPELPAIANLFLDGLRRLRENDNVFSLPESSRKLAKQIEREAIPLLGFIEDCCAVDPNAATECKRTYDGYLTWAAANDIDPVEPNSFGKLLRQTVQTIERTQNVSKYNVDQKTNGRPYYYAGIRLNELAA